MEYASYLAGERWSDHPACTPPLIAELARQVNDFSCGQARQALVELVPDMIGLPDGDLAMDLRVARRAARTALPIAPEPHQRIMAVGLLTCERLQAGRDGGGEASLTMESADALAQAPSAAAWASAFTRHRSISPKTFRRQTAPTIVRYAVLGIANACAPDRDAVLHDLLVGAIEDCKDASDSSSPGRGAHHGVVTSAAAPVPSAATSPARAGTITASH